MNRDILNAETMYRDFDISEWEEKQMILSNEEVDSIIKGLNDGVESELIELVRKPFPKFIEGYYKYYEMGKVLLKDPTFGYRFYLLKDYQAKYLNEMIKYPHRKVKDYKTTTRSSIDKGELNEMLNIPFERITTLVNSDNPNLELEKKYIYISQYIDEEEAKRMGLSGFTYYTQGKYRGFELEEKLDSLNGVVRRIVCMYLGLYGEKRRTIGEISKELRVSIDRINKLFGKEGYIFYPLMRSTQEFRNKIGYIEHDYRVDEFKEYKPSIYGESYYDTDLFLEIQYTLNNRLEDSEREVLKGLNNRAQRAYITRKYIEPKRVVNRVNLENNRVMS